MTERIDADYEDFDRWPMRRRVAALVEANRRAVDAAETAIDDLTRAAEGISTRLRAGGRLVYAGAGTSGRLALQDAAELPPTFGFEGTVVLIAGGASAGGTALEGAEDDADAAVRAVEDAAVGAGDALVALAASGRTPFTVAAVRRARSLGAFTIGIANNPMTPLLSEAEVGILLDTGSEVVAGSTRLVAGTAQKIALNALSTAPMPDLGAVHGNLMVGMRPKNEKLLARAMQIVTTATGCDDAAARSALEASEWDVRTAVVALLARVSPEVARAALAEHGGVVRRAEAAAERGRRG